MRKKTLIWLMGYMGGIGTSFIKGPIIALATYMYTFYTQFTSWAKGAHGRWSLYVSLTLLASYLIKKGSLEKLQHLKMPQFKWLILILINMFLVTPFAAVPAKNNATIVEYVKLLILYYLIISVIRTRKDYKIFLWAQILGNFNLGWEAYTRGRTVRGRLENIGAPGITGSNFLASHTIMVLPFVAISVLFGNKREKLAGSVCGAFIFNTLILCNSRGAFISVAAMTFCAFILGKKWMWKKFILGLVLGVVGVTAIGGAERVMARLETVQSYEDEPSASGRVDTWKGAWKMAMDYPIGKGGDGFAELSPIYIPEVVEHHGGSKRAVHNTYLMMLTNWGFQGLILFLGFIGSTIRELDRVRKRTGSKDDKFYHLHGLAIELALIAYSISSIFGNRIYFESLYWYTSIATALSNIQQSEIKDVMDEDEKK
ncbi:MAG: hypothetical protein GY749_40755 [Desulfobacteraceae bacterium]|nr:hypothetical protein [Desulfobacteraceae bacterium]